MIKKIKQAIKRTIEEIKNFFDSDMDRDERDPDFHWMYPK